MRCVLIPLFVALSSCTSVPEAYEIDPASPAIDIPIVRFVPSTERHLYDEVKLSECELGMNGRSTDTNVEACENHFRKDAQNIGATLILLHSAERGKFDDELQWTLPLGYCKNCVTMSAILLRPKSKRYEKRYERRNGPSFADLMRGTSSR